MVWTKGKRRAACSLVRGPRPPSPRHIVTRAATPLLVLQNCAPSTQAHTHINLGLGFRVQSLKA
eukprot:361697-Chlamydomonas_euryale.AAC.7